MSELIRRAEFTARILHASQVRKYTGEPYVNHCAEVASLVGRVFIANHDEMVAAAWLHDTIEDCGVDATRIERLFGGRVCDYVMGMTDHNPAGTVGNRRERKEREALRLYTECEEVQNIKCADLISNTHTIAVYDRGFACVYLREARRLYLALYKADPFLRHALKHSLDMCENIINIGEE